MISDRWPSLRRSPRERRHDEDGLTLVELLVASTLLVVLTTIIIIAMTTFVDIGNQVSAQYSEYDQAVPSMSALQAMARAEVEPGPATGTGAPTPGFGINTIGVTPNTVSGIGSFTLTFYADVQYPTGQTPQGPAKILAEEVTSTGAAVTTTTTCTYLAPCEFEVWETLPKTNSCPSINGDSATVVCSYTTNAPKMITDVKHVVNNPAVYYTNPQASCPTIGSSTCSPAIFNYSIFDPIYNVTLPVTPANLAAAEANPGSYTKGAPIALGTNYTALGISSAGYTTATTAYLGICAPAGAPGSTYPSLALSCPADQIQRIGIDLQINQADSGTNGGTENQLVIYRNQGNSQSTSDLPFEFNQSVG